MALDFCRSIRRPLVPKPCVLVLHEKHGEGHYYIPDDQALFTTALLILKGRKELGFWYYDPKNEKSPEAPDFTKESIPKLPVSMQAAAKAKLQSYLQAKAEHEYAIQEFSKIGDAINQSDGALAWEILRDRSEGYERCSLEHLFTSYG